MGAEGGAGGPAGETGGADATLRRLEQRLEQASAAAERLLGDAAQHLSWSDEPAAAGPRRPPPAGWQQPAGGGGGDGWLRAGDAELLLGLLGVLRDRVPPELQRRLLDALHDVLLAVRALIDWYLERTDRRAAEPAEVQDIPIL